MKQVLSGLFALLLIALCSHPAFAQQPSPAPSSSGEPVQISASTHHVPPEVLRRVEAALHGPDLRGKDGPLSAIGRELAMLYYQHEAQGPSGVRRLSGVEAQVRSTSRAEHHSPVSPGGRSVAVNAIASTTPAALLSDLRGLGLAAGATAGNVVSGRLPISALKEAARLSSLRGALPAYARTHVVDAGADSIQSEADTAHAATQGRADLGVDGSGQKVCALSDSYDQDGSAATSASDDVSTGDLPGPDSPDGNTTAVDVLDDEVTDGSDEGRAMLQLIHDIAPGATLGFHTAFKGVGSFAEGIRELAGSGCTVIVDDVGSSIEPFYQDGPVSNAVDDVVQNDGVAYFSSAGNDGQNSYEAPFRSSGIPGVIDSASVRHNFSPDTTDTEQAITIEAGGSFTIFTFQWTDPSAIVEGSAGADTDLDIALVDASTDTVVAQSDRDNIGTGVPVESIEYTNESGAEETLNLVIEKAAGPDPDEIKYVYFGSDFQIDEFDTLGPTVYGHPMAEGAMAVAAAPFFNTAVYNSNADPATLASFSSKGGIPILFDQSGTRIPEIVRQKPDVTGTDGIDNTFFGFDLPDDFFNGVDADPHPNFFGTSAAAPNVAAIAALIKQARPGLPPTDVYDRLESTAADVTDRATRPGSEEPFEPVAKGVDPWSGHGFVQAPEAVPVRDVFEVQLAETADPQSGTFELTWRQRSEITVEDYQVERRYFDGPFEPVSATVTESGDQRTIDVGALGLGVFQFRIQWTRSDGTPRQRTTRPDTLGFRSVSTELGSPGDIPNPRGRRTTALSWTVPAGTQGFSYDVERRRGEDGAFEVIGTTQERSFNARLQTPGRYSYRITARDGQGNSLTSPAEPVEIEFDGAAVAIGPYPNPARENATLDLTVADRQTVTVEVYNTIGERIFRDRRALSARTATSLRVDAGRWSSGVYFLRVRGEGFSKTRKLVVVK